jgi:hypothetical protein
MHPRSVIKAVAVLAQRDKDTNMMSIETWIAIAATLFYFFAARGFGTWLLGPSCGRYVGLGIGLLVGALTLCREM